jgi:hypothetical protein
VEHERSHRATLAGDGSPGPVEERIGRRLVRLLDPLGAEAAALSAQCRIDWIGPDGERLGRVPPEAACAELRRRLERALEAADAGVEQAVLRDGLRRLESWTARLSAPRPRRRRGSPLHP